MSKRTGIIVFIVIVFLIMVFYHIFPAVEQFVNDYAALLTLLGVLLALFFFFYSQHNEKEKISREILETKINTVLSPIAGLCLGREKELLDLEEDSSHKNVLLIKGIAGIGKTTVGLKFRDRLEKGGKNTFWYQCDSESYEGFLLKFSEYLRVRGSPSASYLKDQWIRPEERLKIAVRELCNYPTVLFLDDFQKLRDDSDFGIFKDHLGDSRLVIMSRMQPSFLPGDYKSLQSLDKDPSVNFLRTLDVNEPPEVLEKIYEKTQGHPWSLVHFAQLSRVLPARNLLEDIPDFSEEQQAYVSEQCWKYLSNGEKDFLVRASVFTKPLSFDALEVCSRKEGLSNVLISLVEKFYITKKGEIYYIHDIIRDFALLTLKKNPELHVEAQRAAADYYKRSSSAENLLLMYHHLKEAEDYREAINVIMRNIQHFLREGFWLDVREVLRESLNFFRNEEIIAEICFNLGTIVHKLGEYEKAIEYYEKSLEISEKLGNVHAIALTYNNLGSVYDDKGDYEKAIEYYGRNLKLEKLGDVRLMAQTYGNLGLEYYRTGAYEKAIEYYERDLEISKELGDVQGMSQTYNNLGLIYADKGEYKKAIEYYEKSLEISKKIEDVHGMAQTYGNLGSVHANKGEYEKAIEYHMDCLSILEKLRDVHGMAQIFGNLGNISFARKEYERALEWYQKALEIFEKIGAKHDLKIVNENLSRTYEKLRK